MFSNVRLLSIGDANGDIQRHSENQPLRLEVKTTQDAAMISLNNSECLPGRHFVSYRCYRRTNGASGKFACGDEQ